MLEFHDNVQQKQHPADGKSIALSMSSQPPIKLQHPFILPSRKATGLRVRSTSVWGVCCFYIRNGNDGVGCRYLMLGAWIFGVVYQARVSVLKGDPKPR